MTISPPPKVNDTILKPFQVLASGVDTLYLAVDIIWEDETFFTHLAELKSLAQKTSNNYPLILANKDQTDQCLFLVKPHGTEGYEWLLLGNEYTLKLGKWLTPIGRPNIIQISSEMLWRLGPFAAVERILHLLEKQKAHIKVVKVSRADLCLDITFPEKKWSQNLSKYRVTRANKWKPNFDKDLLEGFSFGKGNISARLYDKPLEIMQKSKKFWMYLVWGIDEKLPEGIKIIRPEFQLRREGLKSFGINTLDDLFLNLDKLWASCTRDWLKFQNNPSKHHTQRETLQWWERIQNGFLGVQDATPLIRCKAINVQIDQIFKQAYGHFVSLAALNQELYKKSLGNKVTLVSLIFSFLQMAEKNGKNTCSLNSDIFDKRVKYHRSNIKTDEVNAKRIKLGHPTN